MESSGFITIRVTVALSLVFLVASAFYDNFFRNLNADQRFRDLLFFILCNRNPDYPSKLKNIIQKD